MSFCSHSTASASAAKRDARAYVQTNSYPSAKAIQKYAKFNPKGPKDQIIYTLDVDDESERIAENARCKTKSNSMGRIAFVIYRFRKALQGKDGRVLSLDSEEARLAAAVGKAPSSVCTALVSGETTDSSALASSAWPASAATCCSPSGESGASNSVAAFGVRLFRDAACVDHGDVRRLIKLNARIAGLLQLFGQGGRLAEIQLATKGVKRGFQTLRHGVKITVDSLRARACSVLS